MSIKALNQPVADNISFIISVKGLKQKAVAEREGITVQAFNDMLNGRRLIKMADIRSIANALEIDAGELFNLPVLPNRKEVGEVQGKKNSTVTLDVDATEVRRAVKKVQHLVKLLKEANSWAHRLSFSRC